MIPAMEIQGSSRRASHAGGLFSIDFQRKSMIPGKGNAHFFPARFARRGCCVPLMFKGKP